jgi:hypothetical protein
MKSYWYGVSLAGLLLSGIWLLGIEHQLNFATASSRWVFDAYQHKIAAAAAADKASGSRVLIVAGSNAMFGIDSQQFEEYWHKPVINLGVNAGLGLPYILDVSKRVAKPGDIIVMPMEYAMYLDDGSPNAQLIDYVIARDTIYWHQLSLYQRWRFTIGMAPERWVQGLRHLPDAAVTSGTYGAHHLDARGDQTHSSPADRSDADKSAVSAAKSWNYGARANTEAGGWSIIADYAKWAKKNNVCVIAVPTVLLHHDKYDHDPQDLAFYAGVPGRIQAAGIAYVGLPRDFMYPADWFFDTDHHLQDWARARHTAKLIALLNQDPLSYCKK